MSIVAVCVVLTRVLLSFQSDSWQAFGLRITSKVIWLVWLIRVMKREDDRRGLQVMKVGACMSFLIDLPAVLMTLPSDATVIGPSGLFFVLVLIEICGWGACLLLGILFLIRKRAFLGTISLMIGLWNPGNPFDLWSFFGLPECSFYVSDNRPKGLISENEHH